ncbi:MAG: ABC transporter substrate-binding protein [Treponema sp.]|jgi:ABC-type glycerol-3-phosphate transport system substrate-binding protein|nr:ABC transporter substrate-binding protein [Treponema sp.]
MKRILLAVGVALVLFSGCPGKKAGDAGGALVVWSFTDEIGNMVNDYWKGDRPNAAIDYSFTPSDQFETKLDPVLASGRGVPDVFALESAFVRKYIESGLLLDITDVYEANKAKLLTYPVEIGSFGGRVYGMSWQACPGALFYRRSLAQKYLGTDDPKVVQTYFTDLNKFLDTARLLKERSNGSCVLVSSSGDVFQPIFANRTQPWVVNNRLVIDPAMEQLMDINKLMYDNRWEGRVGQWSEGWFAGMKGELRDESGNPVEVFSYFLPTWGLHYVLKTNAPATSGDWAMVPGPVPYRWGGTWIAAYKDTPRAQAAKDFISYITTDDSFMERWAKDTGDLVSNLTVVNRIKDNYSEPFLGGQNHYAEFAEMAKGVNGRLLQGTDQAIEGLWHEAVAAFVNGEKSKAQALADFRSQAEAVLGL